MDLRLKRELEQQNPWLKNPSQPFLALTPFYPRHQTSALLDPELDCLATVLIGPRRAGKTILGKYLAQELITQKRFSSFFYLNCDLERVRSWLESPLFLDEALHYFALSQPIFFIDEVQRLPSPGLFLKTLVDLQRPLKIIASGSSQLELNSQVTEHMTGRNFTSLVLPLSFQEQASSPLLEDSILYGSYPQVITSSKKKPLLKQLFENYVNKDIIEILRVEKPDIFKKLIALIAHSSGQLVNYHQLSTDCQVPVATVKNYIDIAKKTFIIEEVKPFSANKRTELTTNPIFYFIDNGFRNQALNNFSPLESRTDAGLLIESAVFQELYKTITQNFESTSIHYWRTKAGAEVDFVLAQNDWTILPVEVKYRSMNRASITRGFRSFLEAYKPKEGIVLTKNFIGHERFVETEVSFIPFEEFNDWTTKSRHFILSS